MHMGWHRLDRKGGAAVQAELKPGPNPAKPILACLTYFAYQSAHRLSSPGHELFSLIGCIDELAHWLIGSSFKLPFGPTRRSCSPFANMSKCLKEVSCRNVEYSTVLSHLHYTFQSAVIVLFTVWSIRPNASSFLVRPPAPPPSSPPPPPLLSITF